MIQKISKQIVQAALFAAVAALALPLRAQDDEISCKNWKMRARFGEVNRQRDCVKPPVQPPRKKEEAKPVPKPRPEMPDKERKGGSPVAVVPVQDTGRERKDTAKEEKTPLERQIKTARNAVHQFDVDTRYHKIIYAIYKAEDKHVDRLPSEEKIEVLNSVAESTLQLDAMGTEMANKAVDRVVMKLAWVVREYVYLEAVDSLGRIGLEAKSQFIRHLAAGQLSGIIRYRWPKRSLDTVLITCKAIGYLKELYPSLPYEYMKVLILEDLTDCLNRTGGFEVKQAARQALDELVGTGK